MPKTTMEPWNVGMMFGGYKTFKPYEDYKYKGRGGPNRYFIYGKGLVFPSKYFVQIIVSDYFHREAVQLEEQCEKEVQALQKASHYGDRMKDLRIAEEALELARRATDITGRTLYCHESYLPRRPLKKIYDRIRQDPAWYLQKDLVQDCIAMGGCCSRDCRCCENRHLNSARKRGIGHCTTVCPCCEIHRGFDYTVAEQKVLADDFERDLSSSNPAYLLTMTEAYFSKPGMFGPEGCSIARAATWQLNRLKRSFRDRLKLV